MKLVLVFFMLCVGTLLAMSPQSEQLERLRVIAEAQQSRVAELAY